MAALGTPIVKQYEDGGFMGGNNPFRGQAPASQKAALVPVASPQAFAGGPGPTMAQNIGSGLVPGPVGKLQTQTVNDAGVKPFAPPVTGIPVGTPKPAVPTVPPPTFPAMPGGTGPTGAPSTVPKTPSQQAGVNPGNADVSNLSAGVDSSLSGLLPTGFNIGQLTAPAQPDATTPGAPAYVQQAAPQLTGATPWVVTPEQTVAGQYANLMAQGNPAIKAAEEASLRANAASGGRNSTMAQGAASLAGSQVALAIASQDAQINAAAGEFNAAQANQFAEQQNQFVQNATLSEQNFQQGVAMLKDQTTQANAQLYAQVQASAAAASINIKTTLENTQIATNATLAQMDKTFAQANNQAWTNFGMQVRMGYLAALNTQQNALMQTIGEINANPNITSAQASAAIQQAVQQFNSFMTMNNAYYSSMTPESNASMSGQYNAGAFPYG